MVDRLPFLSRYGIGSCTILPRSVCNEEGEGIIFANAAEVITAYQMEQAHLHARIKVTSCSGLLIRPLVAYTF